jgi:hypothetical protein
MHALITKRIEDSRALREHVRAAYKMVTMKIYTRS